jgi:hypothetical protein
MKLSTLSHRAPQLQEIVFHDTHVPLPQLCQLALSAASVSYYISDIYALQPCLAVYHEEGAPNAFSFPLVLPPFSAHFWSEIDFIQDLMRSCIRSITQCRPQ